MTRQQAVQTLIAGGTRIDIACMYAEAYVEYQEAAANIRQHGVLVQHPKSGAPIQNPYLSIRDRASAKMRTLRVEHVAELWPSASTETADPDPGPVLNDPVISLPDPGPERAG